eukprot:TRINITY_DN1971_c0_g1_i6.p3 TRINITY_DN1971_c0_g1~~TRINITY_DN1971_c0_g1_i6.p3  ORF type:complete len:116 (-),score=37.08 TRINITY_DN1971_c0_g1_i6:115-462(-)
MTEDFCAAEGLSKEECEWERQTDVMWEKLREQIGDSKLWETKYQKLYEAWQHPSGEFNSAALNFDGDSYHAKHTIVTHAASSAPTHAAPIQTHPTVSRLPGWLSAWKQQRSHKPY